MQPSRRQLRDEALSLAYTQVGVREDPARPNTGPEINQYLAAVGLPPGAHWCAALVVWCYSEVCKRYGVPMPIKRTGKVSRLWHSSPLLFRSDKPTKGSIFCRLENPADLMSPGHCGFVIRIGDFDIETIEGNTNALGSRIGDRVRINKRKPGYINLGYIDVGREGPAGVPVLAS